MKKTTSSQVSATAILISIFSLFTISAKCQDSSQGSPALPENVNNIVKVSCVPCHTSNGGMMSRTKLNFSQWTEYSVEKQKEKAQKMASVLKKSAMPPKSARETRPDIIPSKEQVEIIRKWAESLKSEEK